jgi:hypothetical protein
VPLDGTRVQSTTVLRQGEAYGLVVTDTIPIRLRSIDGIAGPRA